MVRNKKNKHLIRENYKQTLLKLTEFENILMKQPSAGNGYVASHWSKSAIINYYRLRYYLKSDIKDKSIQSEIKKLPLNVWILMKYVYEIALILVVVFLFIFYIKYLPVFKGMFSFYVGFTFLLWFFTREWIRRLEEKVIRLLYEIKKKVESALK